MSLITSTMVLPIYGAYLIERWKMRIDERGERTRESVPSKLKKALKSRKSHETKRDQNEVQLSHELHAEDTHELPTNSSIAEMGAAEHREELPTESNMPELEGQMKPVELQSVELAELPEDNCAVKPAVSSEDLPFREGRTHGPGNTSWMAHETEG